jgi:hypothetical protein
VPSATARLQERDSTAWRFQAIVENGRVGWTGPYLDLVGAGMKLTASYPIQDCDRLLGVASRDIIETGNNSYRFRHRKQRS